MYIIFKILFHHKERSVLDLSGPFVKQSKLRMTVKEKLPVVNSPGVCVCEREMRCVGEKLLLLLPIHTKSCGEALLDHKLTSTSVLCVGAGVRKEVF